jgi:hypothetical protein
VKRVGDVERPDRIDRERGRKAQLCGRGQPSVTEVVGGRASTGDGRDLLCDRIDSPHDVVRGIGDVEVAAAVDDDRQRFVQSRSCGIPAVTGVTLNPRARNGSDESFAVDLADAMGVVARVRDVEISLVPRNSEGTAKKRGGGRSAIADARIVRVLVATGNRRDHTGRCVDPANATIVAIGDVEVSGVVEGDSPRPLQRCAARRSSVAAEASAATAGIALDDAGRQVDPLYGVAIRLGDVEPSTAVEGNAMRSNEIDRGGVEPLGRAATGVGEDRLRRKRAGAEQCQQRSGAMRSRE